VVGAYGPTATRHDGRCLLPPERIVVGVNNVCNLHCKMCDVGIGDDRTVFWANLIGENPRNMPVDLFREIVAKAKRFRPQPKIALAFTEPLIHPKILDMVSIAVGEGLQCSITSNGSTLPRYADALVEIGLQNLNISVDGPPQVHNSVRGSSRSFEQLFEGVEMVNSAKARLVKTAPQVHLTFTITDENARYIVDFVRAVTPLRPATIVISQLNFITDEMASAHNAQYHDDLSVVRSNIGTMDLRSFDAGALASELHDVRTYAASAGLNVVFVPDLTDRFEIERYYREPLTFIGGRTCTDPYKMMMVKTDGTVIPAHGRCFNYPIGNIRESALTDLWNNDRYRAFRRLLADAGGTLPACARCCGVIGKKDV